MTAEMGGLVGVVGDFNPGNRTHRFTCNYGVNPEYRRPLEDGGLRVSGVGAEGEIRIVEIPGHPCFLATLFLPQARSTDRRPHPLLAGYAAAVRAHRATASPDARSVASRPARG